MEDCFVIFHPTKGYLKAQSWYKSLDEGVKHHGRFPTLEAAISSARLMMTKSLDKFQAIRDSSIINLVEVNEPGYQYYPAMFHMNVESVKTALYGTIGPITNINSIVNIVTNAENLYNGVDHIHTGLNWNLEDFNREYQIPMSKTLGAKSTLGYASWCARRFESSYSIAMPTQVQSGWFIFDNPRSAMLFKLANADINFEVYDLASILKDANKEMKKVLDILKPIT